MLIGDGLLLTREEVRMRQYGLSPHLAGEGNYRTRLRSTGKLQWRWYTATAWAYHDRNRAGREYLTSDGGLDAMPGSSRSSARTSTDLSLNPAEASSSLMAEAKIIEEDELGNLTQAIMDEGSVSAVAAAAWMEERGIVPEDFDEDYGLIDPGDTVIIRPYGGEDDDILLNELRPRFVVCYEPNLAFIRRLEVSYWRQGRV
jgi:hypothetical protein